MAYKFVLNGKNVNALNRLVLETVKIYTETHPNIQYNELKSIFKDELQGTYGVIKSENEFKNLKLQDPERRFFTDEKDIIELKDTKIYVSRGWGDDWFDKKSKQQKKGNKQKFLKFVREELKYQIDEELDRDGFRRYLEKLGFAPNGINTYLGYINQQKIDILNKINEYKNLTDEEKVLEFAKVDNSFKDEFNKYHQYSKDYTFSDILSGARRYELYKKYLYVTKTMEEYKNNSSLFDTNSAYMYFKVFNDNFLYPIKSICRKNRNILELEDDFTTNQAKGKLTNIFNFKNNNSNIKFIDNRNKDEKNDNKSIKIKNIILYGAPGVGKTYSYQQLISMIESGYSEKKIFSSIKNNEQIELNREEFQKIKDDKRMEFVTFHQSYSYEDFIEGLRPQKDGSILPESGLFKNLVDDAKKSENNFYIVIDEINRGNISKIFGELITLIEESKRDDYEVTLPYSKEKFKVPSNLYIIATMNSTDKSIATVDIALRRRFTFLKMKPNPNLVKNEEAQQLMKELNQYITKELSEDYVLGHSYFMDEDIDIEFIKEYKIKPLLEEYFYSDEKTPDDIIKIAQEEYKKDD